MYVLGRCVCVCLCVETCVVCCPDPKTTTGESMSRRVQGRMWEQHPRTMKMNPSALPEWFNTQTNPHLFDLRMYRYCYICLYMHVAWYICTVAYENQSQLQVDPVFGLSAGRFSLATVHMCVCCMVCRSLWLRTEVFRLCDGDGGFARA